MGLRAPGVGDELDGALVFVGWMADGCHGCQRGWALGMDVTSCLVLLGFREGVWRRCLIMGGVCVECFVLCGEGSCL